jgi:Mg2+ and Co2+ transporter CorA
MSEYTISLHENFSLEDKTEDDLLELLRSINETLECSKANLHQAHYIKECEELSIERIKKHIEKVNSHRDILRKKLSKMLGQAVLQKIEKLNKLA